MWDIRTHFIGDGSETLTEARNDTQSIRVIMDYGNAMIRIQRPNRDGGSRKFPMEEYDKFEGGMDDFIEHVYSAKIARAREERIKKSMVPKHHYFVGGRIVPRDRISVLDFFPPTKTGKCIFGEKVHNFIIRPFGWDKQKKKNPPRKSIAPRKRRKA